MSFKFWHGLTLSLFLLASVVWAADSRITSLSELTAPSSADFLEIVDVSDTTDDATGSSRKVLGISVGVESCTRQEASRTLTSSVAEQALFDSGHDTITLATGTYYFHGMAYVTGLSATSGNMAFDFIGAGTATASDILYHALGIDASTPTTAAAQTGSFTITQQSGASVISGATGTGAAFSLRGSFEITGSGTIIPSVTLVTAAAGTVAAGTHFCVQRWGDTGFTERGGWQ